MPTIQCEILQRGGGESFFLMIGKLRLGQGPTATAGWDLDLTFV